MRHVSKADQRGGLQQKFLRKNRDDRGRFFSGQRVHVLFGGGIQQKQRRKRENFHERNFEKGFSSKVENERANLDLQPQNSHIVLRRVHRESTGELKQHFVAEKGLRVSPLQKTRQRFDSLPERRQGKNDAANQHQRTFHFQARKQRSGQTHHFNAQFSLGRNGFEQRFAQSKFDLFREFHFEFR